MQHYFFTLILKIKKENITPKMKSFLANWISSYYALFTGKLNLMAISWTERCSLSSSKRNAKGFEPLIFFDCFKSKWRSDRCCIRIYCFNWKNLTLLACLIWIDCINCINCAVNRRQQSAPLTANIFRWSCQRCKESNKFRFRCVKL